MREVSSTRCSYYVVWQSIHGDLVDVETVVDAFTVVIERQMSGIPIEFELKRRNTDSLLSIFVTSSYSTELISFD